MQTKIQSFENDRDVIENICDKKYLQKEEFINDPEANAMRSRPERDPWKLKNLVV